MSTKICGSLNNDCRFLSIFGRCRSDSFCEDEIFIDSPNSSDTFALNMMRNLRALHQENMELKQLLLELKQNKK